ncbi:MAG: hypothetical protein RR718_15870 [Comamonas sp.]
MSHRVPEEILQLARQGEKVRAIALLREQNGLGLAQAKQLLEERLEDAQGKPNPATHQSFTPEDVMTAIDAALASGEKLQAIKLLCDSTGIGLLEAKQRIEQRMGMAPSHADRDQSPGEVTRSSGRPFFALLLSAAAAAALWYYFSKN